MNNRSTAKNVVMEQRADIKALFLGIPGLREVVRSGGGGGIHVNMIGPIQITHVDGSQEQDHGIVEIDGVEIKALPAPGEQHELMLLRDVKDDLPAIDEAVLKKFEPIFRKLPEPKLESAVRLVVESAHRQDSSPANVAKALNCSLYKAKSVMHKFGLSS